MNLYIKRHRMIRTRYDSVDFMGMNLQQPLNKYFTKNPMDVIASASLLLLLIIALAFQYYTFRAGNVGLDHALMDNIFRNILRGDGVTSHGTLILVRDDGLGSMMPLGDQVNRLVSHYTVHFDPMLYLFAPFRALFSGLHSGVLIATTFWVFLSVIPAVALIKEIEGNSTVAKFTVFIVFALPVGFGMLTNVPHPVILAIPFMIASVYFSYTKRWIWYWVFFFASLLFQESISLFMASFAFVLWRDNKRVAVVTLMVCVIYFVLSMKGGFKYEAQHGLTRHETPRAGS